MPVIPLQVASINTATDNCQVTLTKPTGKENKNFFNFQYSTAQDLDKKNQNCRNLSLSILKLYLLKSFSGEKNVMVWITVGSKGQDLTHCISG